MDDFLALDDWRKCHALLLRIAELLDATPSLRVVAAGADDMADMILAAQGMLKEVSEAEAAEQALASSKAKAAGKIKVMGNLYSFATRLDEEYTKALQKINPHTEEYIERLRMESQLVTLCGFVRRYYERSGELGVAAQVALLSIEHVYYKHDSIAHAVAKAHAFGAKFGAYSELHPACLGSATSAKLDSAKSHPAAASGKPSVEYQADDVAAMIQELCQGVIYRHGDVRVRTRAMLCHIAHHSLHDRFYDARDLLLMSHLQDNITSADVSTQILFNRTMVLLGLCAFRAGLIWDAHQCLSEICSSRVKELLAQGVQSGRYNEKNEEEEKLERRRQVPYHMHINSDLLEACHLISAMLLEVPNMATEGASERPRQVSRYFRKHVDFLERQVFTGPPENTRDTVLVASKALMTGDWQKCAKLLLEDQPHVWNLLPGDGVAEKVKDMLRTKIKCEALRTYLFAYSQHYDSLSLAQLCRMFDLDARTANGVCSKMMINAELHASWDLSTSTIVLHKAEPSRLQSLALQYADKANLLVDSNERLLEAKSGGGKGSYDDRGGKGGGKGWEDRSGGGSWGGSGFSAGGKGKGGGGKVRRCGLFGVCAMPFNTRQTYTTRTHLSIQSTGPVGQRKGQGKGLEWWQQRRRQGRWQLGRPQQQRRLLGWRRWWQGQGAVHLQLRPALLLGRLGCVHGARSKGACACSGPSALIVVVSKQWLSNSRQYFAADGTERQLVGSLGLGLSSSG